MGDDRSLERELAIQDRVLVEADLFGKPCGLRTLIVKVAPDELWLGISSPDRRLETMIERQPVRLTVAGDGYALVGTSNFLRSLGGSKSRVFAVAKPGRLARVQRRAHTRYRLAIEVQFRYLDQVSREPRGTAYAGRTMDVSPAGVLFATAAPLQVGDEIGITLPLASGDRVSVLGLVTRSIVTDPAETADAAAGSGVAQEPEPATPTDVEVAVRFTRITAVDQNRILRFILMMEHRRRQMEAQQSDPGATPAPVRVGTRPASFTAASATPASSPVLVARASAADAVPALAPKPASAAMQSFRKTATSTSPPLGADAPAIAVGLRLCDDSSDGVRKWFDSLRPFDRIELLSQIQTNMSGASVPGAAEPSSVRPLAVAIGLLAP